MSRQMEEQKKLREEGKCKRCWKPTELSKQSRCKFKVHCEDCSVKVRNYKRVEKREYLRQYRGYKRRYANAKSYAGEVPTA